jgi:hypothetical protein
MSVDRIINAARFDRALNGLKALVALHFVFAGITLFAYAEVFWTNGVSRYSLLTALGGLLLLRYYDWREPSLNWGALVAYFLVFALEMIGHGVPDMGYRDAPGGYLSRGGMLSILIGLTPYIYVGLRFTLGLTLIPLLRSGPKPRDHE